LQIIDVGNPAGPVGVGSFDLDPGGQQVNDVQVVGNLAYLAAWVLEIVDVSEPTQPRRVARSDSVYSARAVQVIDQFAYVAGFSANNGFEGLVVVDVSNPAQPQLVGACQTVVPAQDVHVVGNRAYVVASNAPDFEGDHPESWLQIIDVANPAQPTVLGQCRISEEAQALEVAGHYAYIAGGSWREEGPRGGTVCWWSR